MIDGVASTAAVNGHGDAACEVAFAGLLRFLALNAPCSNDVVRSNGSYGAFGNYSFHSRNYFDRNLNNFLEYFLRLSFFNN